LTTLRLLAYTKVYVTNRLYSFPIYIYTLRCACCKGARVNRCHLTGLKSLVRQPHKTINSINNADLKADETKIVFIQILQFENMAYFS